MCKRYLVLLLVICGMLFTSATAANAQTQRSSPGCSGGGKEAEKLFQQALNYEHGLNGTPRDIQKAIELYEAGVELKNPKAAINLGTIMRTMFAGDGGRAERLTYMNTLYEYAIHLGCPDGYYFLALSYYNGWGKGESKATGDACLQKGAEKGSLACMTALGSNLLKARQFKPAEKWLKKALNGGFGFAGSQLSILYKITGKNTAAIKALRQGAKWGDTTSLVLLHNTYALGQMGQPKDKEYAECFSRLSAPINRQAPPPYFENFDQLCPPYEKWKKMKKKK